MGPYSERMYSQSFNVMKRSWMARNQIKTMVYPCSYHLEYEENVCLHLQSPEAAQVLNSSQKGTGDNSQLFKTTIQISVSQIVILKIVHP